jgi:RimJ/RimL family protein N-acetyltransferase
VVDPRNYLAHENLKDGTEVTVRAIRAADAAGILHAFNKLDPESIYRRFFSPKKELSDAQLKHLTEVDFSQVSALVVTTQRDGAEILLGGGRYAVEAGERPQSAELAFLTGGAYRGQGVASLLLRHLKLLAQEAGLLRLEADVLAENQSMLNVFRRSGLPMTQRRERNVLHVTLSLGDPSTCPSFDKSTATQRQPGT